MKTRHAVSSHATIIAILAFVDPFLAILYQLGIVGYLLLEGRLRRGKA